MTQIVRNLRSLRKLWMLLILTTPVYSQTEYLWYEAENMRGFTMGKLGEPLLNPSHMNLSRDKAPGWASMDQVCQPSGRRAARANGTPQPQAPTRTVRLSTR